MKKTFVIALFLLCLVKVGFSQSEKGLARVSKLQGYEVYALCEPLREYEVVFDVTTGAKASSMLTGGMVNEGISDKLSQFVNRAIKEAKEKKQTFDAIVYTGGKKVVAVKFKQEGSEKTKGIARVNKLEGLEVYVMNEPLQDYETIIDVNTGLKAKSYMTGGLVNNSIEEDMAQYVRRTIREAEEAKKDKPEAVVYTGGKRAIGVKLKNS
jgi:ribosomal protein L25 (general stress protein Ctc)